MGSMPTRHRENDQEYEEQELPHTDYPISKNIVTRSIVQTSFFLEIIKLLGYCALVIVPAGLRRRLKSVTLRLISFIRVLYSFRLGARCVSPGFLFSRTGKFQMSHFPFGIADFRFCKSVSACCSLRRRGSRS